METGMKEFPAQALIDGLPLRNGASPNFGFMPGVEPVRVEEASEEDGWVYLRGQTFVVKGSISSAESDDLWPHVAAVYSLDIANLICQGNTDSEDDFLSLMDGLEKMTEWPDRLEVADPVKVEVSEVQHEGHAGYMIEAFVHIRWVARVKH